MRRDGRILTAAFAVLWIARVTIAAFGIGPSDRTLTLVFGLGLVVMRAVLGDGGGGERWLDTPRLVLLLAGLWALEGSYKAIGSDGIEHYSMARSLLFDRDLRLENEVVALKLGAVFKTAEGRIIARGPFGQSLLWMPFVAASHGVTLIARTLDAPAAADGFSAPYQVGVTTASFFFGLAGLLLIERFFRSVLSPWSSAVLALGAFYATPLHFYLVSNPSLSHASQVFLMAALVFFWRTARAGEADATWLWAGVAGGLAGLVRSQDFLLLIPIGLDALLRRGGVRAALKFSAPVLVCGFLQLGVWRELFGPSFIQSMLAFNHVGSGGSHVVDILFSPRHGMVSWTLLYVPAFAGLVALMWREPRFGALAWSLVAISVLTNARFEDWWASDSFGHRRLLGLLPILSLGLALAFDWLMKRPLIPLAAFLLAIGLWNNNLEYIHNAETAGKKTEPLGFDASARAQLNVVRDEIARLDGRMSPALWERLWDHFTAGFVDDPQRLFEIGNEDRAFGAIREGWSEPKQNGDISYRSLLGPRAEIEAALRGRVAMEVTIHVRATPPAEAAVPLEVFFGGRSVGRVTAPLEWTRFALSVPRDSVRTGFNIVGFLAKNEERNGPSIDVDWVRIERRP